MYLIDESKIIGSGFPYASIAFDNLNSKYLKNLDKIKFPLTTEINAGIAAYIISVAKEHDLFSGGDTNMSIIDKDGYRNVCIEEQEKYYNTMITFLSKSLNEDISKLKKSLPVVKSILM